MKPITDKYGLHIIAKVRMWDLIEVKKDVKKKTPFNNKIKSKHFDFILTNPNDFRVLCAIELDDSSHEAIDRQQRDYFVDKVCETVKLPLIHCTGIDGFEDKLCEELKIHKK